jgi:hypothetical protein
MGTATERTAKREMEEQQSFILFIEGDQKYI